MAMVYIVTKDTIDHYTRKTLKTEVLSVFSSYFDAKYFKYDQEDYGSDDVIYDIVEKFLEPHIEDI
jgi:hypothetical protein